MQSYKLLFLHFICCLLQKPSPDPFFPSELVRLIISVTLEQLSIPLKLWIVSLRIMIFYRVYLPPLDDVLKGKVHSCVQALSRSIAHGDF